MNGSGNDNKHSLWEKIISGFLTVSIIISSIFIISFSYLSLKKSSYILKENIIVHKCNENYICELLKYLNISDYRVISKLAIYAAKAFGYKIKLGEYKLPKGVSLLKSIIIFSSEQSVVHKFTIPEGWSVFQVIEKLNNDERLVGKIEKIPEEGTLMPDTYMFGYPTARQKIISMSKDEMKKFLEKAWHSRSIRCILNTMEEALILASIIEKESNRERQKIAGVYINRLKRKMRLQADPTTVYAITKGRPLARKLLRSDLSVDLPHNTYRNVGLPPTPICNPSRESILAALNPEETDCLFFVHGESSHGLFAKTFEEHKRNIKKMKLITGSR